MVGFTTSSTEDDHVVQIYGVRHDDKRNEEEILERTPSPVAAVFHEQTNREKYNPRHLLLWFVLTPSNTLALLLRKFADSWKYSECEKAARALAQRESREVQYIGMRYWDRAKLVFPLHTLVWVPMLFAVGHSSLTLGAGLGIFAVLAVLAMPVTEKHEYKHREAHFTTKICSQAPRSGRTVVVLGQDHLADVCGRLEDEGYRTVSIPLHSILDEDGSD